MSNSKRKELTDTGRGAVGKTAVIGAKDRKTNKVIARVIERTDTPTLQGFVTEHAEDDATIYSDEAKSLRRSSFQPRNCLHSLSEYVRGDVHTNGIESLWFMIKRAHKGYSISRHRSILVNTFRSLLPVTISEMKTPLTLWLQLPLAWMVSGCVIENLLLIMNCLQERERERFAYEYSL